MGILDTAMVELLIPLENINMYRFLVRNIREQ